MAQFRINSQTVIEEICIDSSPKPDGGQRRITLELAAWDGAAPPDIGTASERLIRVIDSTHNTRNRRSTFKIEAKRDANGVAYVYDKSSEKDTLLRVTVGKVSNQNGFAHDLLADLLGRSEDARKIWVYQRILATQNNTTAIERKDWDRLLADQPIKQITDPDHPNRWNCGAALSQFGTSHFGPSHYRSGNTVYYKPFRPRGNTPNRMSDIEFDVERLRNGVDKIRSLLDRKTAVTVFVVHHDGFSVTGGVIQQTGKTHFLTIIGCDSGGKEFIVTDPWPGGSRLMYTSGILGTVDSAFMGKLHYDPGANQMFTPAGGRGAHDYIVLTGP